MNYPSDHDRMKGPTYFSLPLRVGFGGEADIWSVRRCGIGDGNIV